MKVKIECEKCGIIKYIDFNQKKKVYRCSTCGAILKPEDQNVRKK